MEHKKITKDGEMSNFIKKKNRLKKKLDAKLLKENKEGRLLGVEQCFRKAMPWYHINIGYTNPYNVGRVHAELMLIEKHLEKSLKGCSDPILNALKNKEIIFYGIGVGDTEAAIVDWLLKSGEDNIAITGIDVNRDFLENFTVALRNRLIEEEGGKTISYRAYNSLFEQITKKDLINGKLKKAHICLGGTIGNFYDQKSIISTFSNLSESRDILILGIQLETKLEILFEKYRNNSLFREFVLSYIPENERSYLKWYYNKETGIIAAKHNDIEIFRSMKYNLKKLRNSIESENFKLIYQDSDKEKNIGLQVYEKR